MKPTPRHAAPPRRAARQYALALARQRYSMRWYRLAVLAAASFALGVCATALWQVLT
jgi:hypothetical protein